MTKVALVTGAVRGIGRAIALRLADDGYDVAVNDLAADNPELDEVRQEIEAKGRRSLALPADVSLEPEVVRIIQEVVENLGSLDVVNPVMVANAGIILYQSFLDCTVENFDRLMAVNARSTMLCYKYAAKQMIAQGGGGRIIGACSAAGKQGSDIISLYSASKFAVRGLTQAAAREFGKHKITVNAYAPGAIDTRMLEGINTLHASKHGPYAKNGVAMLASSTPIQRTGSPEEVAGLVSYLVSDGSGFVTGQCISINGGILFD
ncbi:NAD(P)-binding protein [Lactifluus subvellereus]|nr:NAD(P)-binding protein [Lactifluus subvellereus]